MTAFCSAKRSLLLFAFGLMWMKYPLIIGGLPGFPADLLFLACAVLWVAALLRGETTLRWSKGFWPLAIYFAALALSAVFSTDPGTSAFKLTTQAYLLAVPVLTYNLIESEDDLKAVALAYVAGAGIVAAMGVATLLLFPFLGPHGLLDWPLHPFGTLPPGPYPRLELTFDYPAMMANYLALALMLVMLSARLGWIGRRAAWIAGGAMLLSALFALTPGFGGLLLMLGAWLWYRRRGTRSGRAALAGGVAAAALEVAIAAVTPVLHRTAPFLIDVPGLPAPLAPSVRLLAWIDAARNFLARPLLGHGIGVDAAHVPYLNPSGAFGIVTDAHNMFLSIAAQAGMLGLAGMAAVVVFAARAMLRETALGFELGLAFLSGLVVQGLVGSFEDARHLWLAYGLLLRAGKLGSSDVQDGVDRHSVET